MKKLTVYMSEERLAQLERADKLWNTKYLGNGVTATESEELDDLMSLAAHIAINLLWRAEGSAE